MQNGNPAMITAKNILKALSKEKYENHKKGIVSVVEERLYKQFPKLILSFNYFNT